MTDARTGTTAPGAGRRILLAVGAVLVATSGVVGFLVGTNNEGRVEAVEVFGTVVLPATGGAVAAYAVVLSAVALAVLFGLVELASRYDEASDGA